MRTTLDIDDPILKEVKAIRQRESRSIGAIVSELLAEALASRRSARSRPSFRWTSRPMKPLVDITDKERLGTSPRSSGCRTCVPFPRRTVS
jgi:hypothetical protein